MTDTTDIKALHEKYTLVLKDLTNRLAECNRLNYCGDELSAFAAFSSTVIDQLEAERQRAVEQLVLAGEEVFKLRAELAALKIDQVPVAEIRLIPSNTGRKPCIYWFGKQDMHFPVGTQFFTTPKKSVIDLRNVLKVPYRISGQHFTAYDADDLHAAIEASGGIVKDGE